MTSSSFCFLCNAFTPLSSFRPFRNAVQHYSRQRWSVGSHRPTRACATSNEKTGALDAAPKYASKSEEMAALLGRNVEEEKLKSDQLILDGELDRRQRVLLALGTVLSAVLVFVGTRLDPVNPIRLLRAMEENSAAVSEIGNGRPTVVEFYASWCENCILSARDMSELETDYGPLLNFIVVDAEKEANKGIIDRFDVSGIPYYVMLDAKGNVVNDLIGKIPKKVLAADFQALSAGEDLPYKGIGEG